MKIIAICAIDQEAVKFELPNAEIHFIQGGVGKTLSAFISPKPFAKSSLTWSSISERLEP